MRGTLFAALACALALALLLGLGDDGEGPAGPTPPAKSEGGLPPDPPPAPADEDPAPEEQEAAAAAGSVERTLVVLGPSDTPIAGVLVERRSETGARRRTDANGRAVVPFASEPEGAWVEVSGPVPRTQILLREPETVHRFPDLLPLSVLVVDGETGEAVGGAGVSFAAVPLVSHGARLALPISPARPGETLRIEFRVEPPPGYAAPGDLFQEVEAGVSAFARSVEAVIPLFREARLFARVEAADGTPAAGAEIGRVELGGQPVAGFEAGPVGADGRTRIRGVPALRGEPVTVRASRDGRSATSEAIRLGPSTMPVEATVRLPERAAGTGSRRFTIDGLRASASIEVHFPGRGRGTGRIVARVLRRDGSPAAGAEVRFSVEPAKGGAYTRSVRADASGKAVLEDLPEAEVTVAVREPGFLAPPAQAVSVGNAETVTVEIREAAPTTAAVTVLDADGRPVPFARLFVADRDGVAYARLEGDRQMLTLFTDLEGRAVLPDLPAGGTKITARFGSRKAEGVTEDGAPLTLRLSR